MRADARGRVLATAVAVALTASLAAGCMSGKHHPSGTTASAPSTPSTASSTTSTPASSAAATSASPSAAVSSSPVGSSGPAENRVVTADVRAQLLAGYLATQGFAADQIGGTLPGSVFYAYVPSTNTYWASATFVASTTAAEQTKVTLQDEGAAATFTRVGTGTWEVHLHPLLWPCPGDLPAGVLAAWQLAIVEGCEVTSPSATS